MQLEVHVEEISLAFYFGFNVIGIYWFIVSFKCVFIVNLGSKLHLRSVHGYKLSEKESFLLFLTMLPADLPPSLPSMCSLQTHNYSEMYLPVVLVSLSNNSIKDVPYENGFSSDKVII